MFQNINGGRFFLLLLFDVGAMVGAIFLMQKMGWLDLYWPVVVLVTIAFTFAVQSPRVTENIVAFAEIAVLNLFLTRLFILGVID